MPSWQWCRRRILEWRAGARLCSKARLDARLLHAAPQQEVQDRARACSCGGRRSRREGFRRHAGMPHRARTQDKQASRAGTAHGHATAFQAGLLLTRWSPALGRARTCACPRRSSTRSTRTGATSRRLAPTSSACGPTRRARTSTAELQATPSPALRASCRRRCAGTLTLIRVLTQARAASSWSRDASSSPSPSPTPIPTPTPTRRAS